MNYPNFSSSSCIKGAQQFCSQLPPPNVIEGQTLYIGSKPYVFIKHSYPGIQMYTTIILLYSCTTIRTCTINFNTHMMVIFLYHQRVHPPSIVFSVRSISTNYISFITNLKQKCQLILTILLTFLNGVITQCSYHFIILCEPHGIRAAIMHGSPKNRRFSTR